MNSPAHSFRRLTDNDHRFGPVTWGHTPTWRPWRLVWSSGEEDYPGNSLTVSAFGRVVRVAMPNILKPYRIRHKARWDAETIARLGRDWYEETFPNEYGFSLHDGFLQLFYGPQTGDSINTKDWCAHLPWTQWRFVRLSRYDADGQHFWTETRQWAEDRAKKDACPKVRFQLQDFDGEWIVATTAIEEMEWAFGTGWFKWLSIFRPAKIRRYLDIDLDKETGPEKGSWKGGTLGTSIEMRHGELHEAAMRRFCQQEHRSKSGRYHMHFVCRL